MRTNVIRCHIKKILGDVRYLTIFMYGCLFCTPPKCEWMENRLCVLNGGEGEVILLYRSDFFLLDLCVFFLFLFFAIVAHLENAMYYGKSKNG